MCLLGQGGADIAGWFWRRAEVFVGVGPLLSGRHRAFVALEALLELVGQHGRPSLLGHTGHLGGLRSGSGDSWGGLRLAGNPEWGQPALCVGSQNQLLCEMRHFVLSHLPPNNQFTTSELP